MDLQDTDRFVSLVAPTESGSGCLVVVGRAPAQRRERFREYGGHHGGAKPLMPESMTGAADETGASQRNQEWLGWVMPPGESNGQIQEDVGMPETDLTLEQLQQVLDNLPDIQISPAYTASPDDTPGTGRQRRPECHASPRHHGPPRPRRWPPGGRQRPPRHPAPRQRPHPPKHPSPRLLRPAGEPST